MQWKTFEAFFQQRCFLKFATFNPRDFYSFGYLATCNVCEVFFKVAKKKFVSFSSFRSIYTARVLFGFFFFFFFFFLSLFILRKIHFLRFTQKWKGVKQGRGVIYNEKYLEVLSQRPFWYKKVFSEQHFSKT